MRSLPTAEIPASRSRGLHMLKSHERFHSINGKRQILIADDELINRELLRAVLQTEYDLIFATNGQEALDAARENKDTLSLILLDLMMPVMSGMEMLKQAKADPEIAQIPVIVISADQNAEVECLTIGAIDFIPKPYPQPGVILARVLRTIELSEDREIINSTERDSLTGLYNREYFYRYAEQFDQHHKDMAMDAIVVDVNHFHMINERFGTVYGDSVLQQIGEALRTAVLPSGGIVCRKEADTFMVYCPHGQDYDSLLAKTTIRLTHEDNEGNRIWLRMGVYADVDKSLEIERRFDRAKIAADTVQGSFAKRVGVYDITLHERQLYSEQLIEDFDHAIREHQFVVYYQPKFDVRQDAPILSSAEALVRWIHPKLGMISPGVFIPLFEENGLIQRLDLYVWQAAAAQIHEWRDRLGYAVPVSVNVSRIDMYDPLLVDTLEQVLADNDITTSDLFLEITESAYTQDSEQIIETVTKLRSLGFRVEMDDFGTGYSSLNMISALPIDALKLDMSFVRHAFETGKDTRMIEVIIDIADYLSVPVIAEGVETEEQMVTLKGMGCDFVQGYYFSAPVPSERFEDFLVQRKAEAEQEERNRRAMLTFVPDADQLPYPGSAGQDDRDIDESEQQSAATYASIVKALAADYFSIYYVDTRSDNFVAYDMLGHSQELGIGNHGDNFFERVRESIGSIVHPDDSEMFLSSFNKESILTALQRTVTFTLTCRLMFAEDPTYVHVKVTRMENRSDKHIVIGISNVNDQMRREQEHARALRMANQDALTGVKSKHAYTAEERKVNKAIKEGSQAPFAIVVCDVNNLKQVNDTLGHAAGDQYIKDACAIVCNIFMHSPVFRIGGDEFVAILRGNDFLARKELMARLENTNRINRASRDVSLAGGIAEWDADAGELFAQVFERADAAMYEDKKRQKTLLGIDDSSEAPQE